MPENELDEMVPRGGLKNFAEHKVDIPSKRVPHPPPPQPVQSRPKVRDTYGLKVDMRPQVHDARSSERLTGAATQNVQSYQTGPPLRAFNPDGSQASDLTFTGLNSPPVRHAITRTNNHNAAAQSYAAFSRQYEGGGLYRDESISQSGEEDSQIDEESEEEEYYDDEDEQPYITEATPTKTIRQVHYQEPSPKPNGRAKRTSAPHIPVHDHQQRSKPIVKQPPLPSYQPSVESQATLVNAVPVPQVITQPSAVNQTRKRSREESATTSKPVNSAPIETLPQPEPETISVPRPANLDYEMDKLKQIPYEELKSQPFDIDPGRKDTINAHRFGLDTKLEDKLTMMKASDETQHEEFFKSLTIDQWEQAGDWFLEQFGDVMKKMRDARKEKRKVVEKYEAEVTQRWEEIEGRKKDMDRIMNEIRAQGTSTLNIAAPGRKLT